MNTAKIGALALAALIGSAGAGTLATRYAAAQATAAPQQSPQFERHRFSPARHIDGRIAYLKAELRITDAQAPEFAQVAQAMRTNASAVEQAIAQRRAERGQPQTAIQRLETRAQFAALRAQASDRFLTAFKPLYASLADDQKKAADELLTRHWNR
jgi:hypothetical protein